MLLDPEYSAGMNSVARESRGRSGQRDEQILGQSDYSLASTFLL
jgi:hypothetical protein